MDLKVEYFMKYRYFNFSSVKTKSWTLDSISDIPKIEFTDLLCVTQSLETIGIPRPNAHRSFSVLRTLSVTRTVGWFLAEVAISAPNSFMYRWC